MIAWKVPARGERSRSDALPTGQSRHPGLRRRRIEHLATPREVRRVFTHLVEIVVMKVKVFLVPLIHPPGCTAVEASMHPLGKGRFEGLADNDQPAGPEPRTNLLHRTTRPPKRRAEVTFD